MWAEPVTGSSFIPNFGQKYLETKSYFSLSEETINPWPGSCLSKSKFGLISSISFSELNTANKFISPRNVFWGHILVAWNTDSISFTSLKLSFGKSSWIIEFSFEALSCPLFELSIIESLLLSINSKNA